MPAASSLECHSEIAFQNGHRSDRCNTGGLPGERSFPRSDRSDFNFFELINTSDQDVLRRRVEFTQYASHDFKEVLKEYGIATSMSRRGGRRQLSWPHWVEIDHVSGTDDAFEDRSSLS